jgi:hypothetical protein
LQVSPSLVEHLLKKLGKDKQSSEGKQMARVLMNAHTDFREQYRNNFDELL